MSNNYYSAQYTGNKKIQWKNFTDTSTPLSAANLQKSHTALNDIDQAVAAGFQSVDLTKVDIEAVRSMISGVEYNANTGVFTFHHFDSTLYPDLVINTALEKIIINWSYNQSTQKLELEQEDGTIVEVDLSTLIANPDLQDSDTIAWTVNSAGQIFANIKNNSITDEMLEGHYLASIMTIAGQAETSADEADYYSRLSQSYANGTSNLPDRPTENVDNADYYRRLAQEAAVVSGSILNICGSILTTAGQYKDIAEQSAIASGSSMLIAGQYASEAEMSKIASGSSALIAGQYAQDAYTSSVIAGSAMLMAGISEANALDYSRKSQSYATGDAVDDQGNPYRQGQADDNAKKYCELAQQAAQQAGAADMTGATATIDGAHGLAPQPRAGDQNKVLYGDATYKEIPIFQGISGSIASVSGLVPPATDPDLVLKGNGTWGMGGNDALIAPVEKTSMATNAYSIGQQFVYGGILCKAIATINQGDTFTLNTNYELASDITTQIKAIVDAYVTGIKGNTETNYRKGNVNMTLANISADPLEIAHGGTGATSAEDARTNLGAAASNHTHNYAGSSSAGGDATRALKLKDYTNNNDTYLDYGASALSTCDYVGAWNGYRLGSITPANLRNKMGLGSSGAVPVASGGTGSTTAAEARSKLGLGSLAELSSPLDISNGGTGSSTRLGAAKNLTNENVGTSATYFCTLTDSWGKFGYSSAANARSAMGLGNTTDALPVANGGTGATSASAARTNLGLGDSATKDWTGTLSSSSNDLICSKGVYNGTIGKSWSLGTGVNLTNQTSTAYTFTSNGYLIIRASPANAVGGELSGKNCQFSSAAGSYSTFIPVFVLKGMTWKTTIKTDSNCTVYFYPVS